MLEDGTNPWFLERRAARGAPAGGARPRVENGAISRPDIAAAFISEITGAGATAARAAALADERKRAAPRGTALSYVSPRAR